MRVDDLDPLSGEFVSGAPFHVPSQGTHWVFPVNAFASDPVAASVFTAHIALLHTAADGTDHDQRTVSSTLLSPLPDDNTPHPTSSTVVLDKDALVAIPHVLPVRED